MDQSNLLNTLLADLTQLSMNSWEAHWNVEGPNFQEYHALFGSVQEVAYDAIDPLAEHMKALGLTVGYSLSRLAAQTTIMELQDSKDPLKSCINLAGNIESIMGQISRISKFANVGLQNFLGGLHESLGKYHWQLTASAK